MKLTKLYKVPLVIGVVLASELLLGVPTAQSSDVHRANSAPDSSQASDGVIDRQVLQQGQLFLVQTRSRGVEMIREAKVVTMMQSRIVTVEDGNGEVIRVFEGFGGGSDLIATAAMREAQALQLLESGGGIVGL